MTLLDRFRPQSRHNHPDPIVRLSYVAEIPLADQGAIAAIATEDEDARVRQAAVSKLLAPDALGVIARHDRNEDVRTSAAVMLRDIALESFEGVTEADSLTAVETLCDVKVLAHVARHARRDVVALRALLRVDDSRALGSIARHATSEAARLGALDALRDRGARDEIVAVALNGEHKDSAVAAVELMTDRAELEQIAARSRNKGAAKRARGLLRSVEEQAARQAVETHATDFSSGGPVELGEAITPPPADMVPLQPVQDTNATIELSAASTSLDEEQARLEEAERARGEEEEAAAARLVESSPQQAADEAGEAERRYARLIEVSDALARAAADPDLTVARRALALARPEWRDLCSGVTVDPAVRSRFAEAEARVAAREAEAEEKAVRARREALAGLRRLLERVEPLQAKSDLTLKVVDRALRHLRAAISTVPPLPTTEDVEDVTRRLKAVHAALAPRAQELRAVQEWQRWANVAVQEQLGAKMEALGALEDPEAIVREVRVLQEQWRLAADVPRAQADALWRRFKAAHDAIWPRCEAYFAAQALARAENLARKTALCEAVEALADSTRWIQTAEEIKRLQVEWKTIGSVSRGSERAVWDRFRVACDRFFSRRHADLAERKKTWAANLVKKEALAARAEALADSTDWDQTATELRRLQADWKTVGPVKKSQSDALWRRFHGACNGFFARHAQRHEIARGERIAAREAICAELEGVASAGGGSTPSGTAPSDLLATVRQIRARWQQEIAARGVDPERARALDVRFAAAFERVLSGSPAAFAGSELDTEANRTRMESLVTRIEKLAAAMTGPTWAASSGDRAVSASHLAAMLKEALAANTIGGKVDEDSQWRAAGEEVRRAEGDWARIGIVPEEARRRLADRFNQACRRITERAGQPGQAREAGRHGRTGASARTGGTGTA